MTGDPAYPADPTPARAGRPDHPWLKHFVVLVASLIAGYLIVGFVGAIDWAAVATSFSRLEAWQFVPLAGLFLVRQACNAVPLSRFVTGLSWWRSAQSDVSANLIGTIAPPPGDIVLRVGMFRSWGLDPVSGMAGVTLNMIIFYSVRFVAPVLGLVLVAFNGIQTRQWIAAFVCGLLAAAILVSLLLVMRSDTLAALVGRSAAKAVKHARATVDPDRWAQATVDFRARMAQALHEGLVVSMLSMLAMVLTDGLLLLTALRFVGLSAADVSAIDVLAAFLFVYPMTILPLFGLGVLDATLIAAWTEIGGLETEPVIVAGLAVWRAFTLLGPLLLGTLAVLWWRWHARNAPIDSGGQQSSYETKRWVADE